MTSIALPGTGGTVSFRYDPFGRRVQKNSSAGITNYLYDGDNTLEELDSMGNTVAEYTQGPGIDEPLAMLRGTATSFFEADGLGSITSLSNSTGAVAATYTYDSYGKLTASTGTVVNPFRYTGREFDPETGLYYYRARYYDQSVGRFLNEDPLGFDASVNFYPYVNNNPINWIDPLGLKVYRCCRDIDIGGFKGFVAKTLRIKHCFIKTDTIEAGMGPAQGGPLPANPLGIPTRITDHSGQAGASDCKEVGDVNEACVDRELTIGKPTGKCGLFNNCNTLVNQIISKCSKKVCVNERTQFFVP